MSLKPPILTVGKFEHYSVSEHGISFNLETPKGEWLETVRRICHFHDSTVKARERTVMLLADALNYGEQTYGEEFAQAIDGLRESLGLTPKTISNAQWAYKKIDVSRRREGLTLAHYSVIAGLDEPAEQDKYIEFAIKDTMTVQTLKEVVAEAHPKTKRGQKRKASNGAAPTDFQGKLTEVNDHLLNGDINQLGDDWKPILEVIYKIYRRRWQSGRKK